MFRRMTTAVVSLAVAAGLTTAGAAAAGAATTYSTPSLSIVSNHASFVATQTAVFTVHLGGPPSQPVYIFRQAPNHQPVFWTEVDTDAHGNGSFSAYMTGNATWSASYPGNDKYYPALTSTRVPVAAYLTTYLGNTYKVDSKGYHDVHPGQKATFDGSVYPDRHGEALYFSAQYWSNGRWNPIDGEHFAMKAYKTSKGVAYSAAGSTFLGTKGYYYRLLVAYHGDSALGHSISPWNYIHVV